MEETPVRGSVSSDFVIIGLLITSFPITSAYCFVMAFYNSREEVFWQVCLEEDEASLFPREDLADAAAQFENREDQKPSKHYLCGQCEQHKALLSADESEPRECKHCRSFATSAQAVYRKWASKAQAGLQSVLEAVKCKSSSP